jgi:polyisoprenoid-binding protein YceI
MNERTRERIMTPALSLTVLILGQVPGSGTFQLQVEPNHSTIGFSVPIVAGMTRVTGKFNEFAVSMTYDESNVAACSVQVSIKAASVDTGNDARDADLRGALFFAAEEHPMITFTSSRVEKRQEGYAAIGELSIRGVTKVIELPFRFTAVTWEDERPRLGVAAALQLNRLDFGVGADWRHTVVPNFLGNDISIEIFVWTKLGKPIEPSSQQN